MLWLWISLGGYFFNAVSSVINKILLGKSIPNPRVYAFLVSVLGLAGLVLAPWGFGRVSFYWMLISLITGGLFVLSLILLFTALKKDEASQIIPLVGGVQPLIIFSLAFTFLGERLSGWQIFAFILLVVGGVLISIDPSGKGKRGQSGGVGLALLAGLSFGLFYVLTKYIFNNLDFINGFIWPRIGSFAVALFLLFNRQTRKDIFEKSRKMKRSIFIVFIGGQVLGALSFILINYAISLASVTLVNVLQGVQYAFVFVLVLLLMPRFPKLLKEQLKTAIIIQRVISVIIIGAGIALINLI